MQINLKLGHEAIKDIAIFYSTSYSHMESAIRTGRIDYWIQPSKAFHMYKIKHIY